MNINAIILLFKMRATGIIANVFGKKYQMINF